MAQNKKDGDNITDFVIDANQKESFTVTLTDLESGEDIEFLVLADAVVSGKRYFALRPVMSKEDDCFVLSVRGDGDSLILETIEDDDEYDEVEDFFNDLLFSENNYDD